MPELSHTPDWVKNAVFYQIFPDRFAYSTSVEKPTYIEPWDSPITRDGFKGGDLEGVTERLDYLQDLGINAIYFNPIFASTANHRYHTFDYTQVDPILGGNEVFFKLLKEAHKREIYVVLDGVFNHASRGFFQFNHILENGEKSPYLDWFRVYGFPLNAYQGKPNYACWWNMPALPQLNTDNPQVRQFIFQIARYWVEKGIDGWRLDVPFEIKDEGFWRQFRKEVKGSNPEAYIVGEVPWEAQEWLAGDMFDAVMNYQFTAAMVGFFGVGSRDETMVAGMMGLNHIPELSAETFAKRSRELLDLYPRQNALAQMNLLGSHDMPRFLTLVSGNKKALRLATLFQMTYPGAPCVYYGDEIGMAGGRDPENRGTFNWDDSEWDYELRDAFKSYIHIRRENPVLRTGEYLPFHTKDRHLAFVRQLEDQKMLILINAGDQAWDLNLSVSDYFSDETRLENLLGNEELSVEKGHLRNFKLPAWEGAILKVKA
jgi:neopullulanase